jgi:hypothetical protein
MRHCSDHCSDHCAVLQNRSDVNTIQTTVEDLNNRCAVLGRRIERERQERCQDTNNLRQTIQDEIKSLQDVIAHEKATRTALLALQPGRSQNSTCSTHRKSVRKQLNTCSVRKRKQWRRGEAYQSTVAACALDLRLKYRMDERRKYLESAIAYVRTQVEGVLLPHLHTHRWLHTAPLCSLSSPLCRRKWLELPPRASY